MMLFASDVHLSVSSPAENARFFDFIKNTAPQAGAVFLLGDLFDAWVGDDDDSPLAVETKAVLRALTDSGVPVFIQRGNRDFLLGWRFMRETGCSLLPDEYVLPWAGQRYLLTHGDQLTDDLPYRRYRYWVRPLLSFAAACLPLARRQRSALALRKSSRGGVKKASFDEHLATLALRRHRCDCMIHGHLHQYGETLWQNSGKSYRRFCLPDWQAVPGYAVLTNDGLAFCVV